MSVVVNAVSAQLTGVLGGIRRVLYVRERRVLTEPSFGVGVRGKGAVEGGEEACWVQRCWER